MITAFKFGGSLGKIIKRNVVPQIRLQHYCQYNYLRLIQNRTIINIAADDV